MQQVRRARVSLSAKRCINSGLVLRTRQDPRVKQCTCKKLVMQMKDGWTGNGTSRMCEAHPWRTSGRTRDTDGEFEWLEDLATHLKTMGKDKMLRDLLARQDEKKSDALHDLHEYELPPGTIGNATLHNLLHKMDTLTPELNQLKDGSKLTDVDTTVTRLTYLGNKRSPFVERETYGKATPFFKKSVPIKKLHEPDLHGV